MRNRPAQRLARARVRMHRVAGDLVAQKVDCARIDPYFLWALFTDFKGFGGRDQLSDLIPFIVEVKNPGDCAKLAQQSAPGGRPLAHISASYASDPQTRFCTARVKLGDVARFLASEHVRRAKMGLPGTEMRPPAGTTDSLERPERWSGWSDETPFVAVIDHGIAFLRRGFTFDVPVNGIALRIPRVVRFWDQWAGLGESAPPIQRPWRAQQAYGYGRELDMADIAELLRGAADEFDTYRSLLDYRPVLGRAAHGTHVLDIAAGWPNPLRPTLDDADARPPLPIVAVQLPWLPEKDVSGASLGVHVLDAMRYILDSAGLTAKPAKKRNVVVNLSDGGMAGSHNAGSIIEAALDELLARPGLSLVIAAGNAYRAKAHCEGDVRPRHHVELQWQLLPDDRTESFMEIWFPRVAAKAVIELSTPGGGLAFSVPLGQSRIWPADGLPEVLAAGIHLQAVSCGKGQMALLALRPTRSADAHHGVVPHGVWQVRIRNDGRSPLRFEAWIERDDPPFGDPGPRRQSRFGAGWSRRNTLNSVATGQWPIVVGAYRLKDDALASYSAAGSLADSRKRPTVIAPGEETPALPGLRAAGNGSGSTFRMNGTSVAAPIVTRLIAEALRDAPKPRQYTASEIQQSVRTAAILATTPEDPECPAIESEEPLRVGAGWIRRDTRLRLPP
jgi:subtilisin family serine protease